MAHFGDQVIGFLKNTATKLEELQLQTTLGKADLSDKLEEIKKETKENIHQITSDVNSYVEQKKEDYNLLKGKLEHLELQLALAKAETEEELSKQRKNLKAAFKDVKDIIMKS